MAAKDELGRRGEQLAADYLEQRGYRVIDRNWRCRHGELDIVARLGPDTVFVEVKTRSGRAFGHPFESVTHTKLARLRTLASTWCGAHEGPHGRVRIDVVAVIAARGAEPLIEHLEGVVR